MDADDLSDVVPNGTVTTPTIPDAIELITGEDGELYVETEADDTPLDHGANLVSLLTQDERTQIANKFIDLIERDIEDRKDRDKKLADALKRTGFGHEAPGGADFEGASRVTHPLIGEATIDFAARERKELLPPNGPVKTYLPGKITAKDIEKSNRKAAFLNKQLTLTSKTFQTELGKMLSQLPLGGSEYVKTWWDSNRNCPEFQFIAIENFFLPSAASGFITAHRRTIREKITDQEFEDRVASNLYELPDTETTTDEDGNPTNPTNKSSSSTFIQQDDEVTIVKNQIQGVTPDPENQDGLREVFECYTTTKIPELDDKAGPYIIHLDHENKTVLGIYKNWDENDETRQEIDWITDFGFIKWEGPYDIGLPHLIGGLAVALTGGMRALLDSALIQTAPTALKLSTTRMSGQSIPINIAQINNIEATGVSDIRQIIMPLPLNGPSPTLMSLLELMHELGRGVVRTALDEIPTENPETPVGTQLSRVEQALVVYSDIHAGLHRSMTRLLGIVNRLNRDNLPANNQLNPLEGTPRTADLTAEDFEDSSDIVPISDPKVFSELQRYQQAQMGLQLMQMYPQHFNQKAMIRILMETGNVRFTDEVLLDDPEPQPISPIEENLKMMQGEKVTPMIEDDQLMHIETIKSFLSSTFLGLNPVMAPTYLPLALENISKRVVYWHINRLKTLSNDTQDPTQQALILTQVTQEANQIFADLVPIAQQAAQLLQSLQPQDPATKVAMAEIDRETKRDQAAVITKTTENQIEAQKNEQTAQAQQAKVIEQRMASLDKVSMNDADNATAMQLAAFEAKHGNVKIRNTRLPGQ